MNPIAIKKENRYSQWLRPLVFLSDLLVLNLTFLVLYVQEHYLIATYEVSWFVLLGVLNASWLIIAFYANPYRITRVFHFSVVFIDISYTVFQHILITIAAIHFLGLELLHVWSLPLAYLLLWLVMVFWRLALFHALRVYRSRGYNFREVIIVGMGTVANRVKDFFEQHPELGFRFRGYFDDTHGGPLVIGKIDGLDDYLKTHHVDEIYCCLPYLKYGEVRKVISLGEDRLVKVKLIMDFRSFASRGLALERFDQIPVLNVSSLPLDDRRNQVVKRVFDLIFAGLVFLLILSWLFPLIALIIKLDSRGPVLFKQRRTGMNNTEFLCHKFRTMRVNEEADNRQASRNDDRITAVGAWLRKTSLDELPQFLNVLRGEMSVVGPRPHMLKHTEEYSKLIGKFMARHFVKPGVTGLAQSKGYRGETRNVMDMHNRVRLDRFYIENWSFFLDVKIVLLTVFELIRGDEKAY